MYKLREITWAKRLARVSGLPHVRTTLGLASVFLAQATRTMRGGIVPHLPLGTPNHEGLTQCLTSPQTSRSQEGTSTATGGQKEEREFTEGCRPYPVSLTRSVPLTTMRLRLTTLRVHFHGSIILHCVWYRKPVARGLPAGGI